jgi:tRNA 2-selenouridine synthase SelU
LPNWPKTLNIALTYTFDILILRRLREEFLPTVLNFPEMRRDDPVKFTDSDHARRLLNNLIGKVAGKNTCRQSRNHRYKATKNTAHYCMKEVPIYIRRGDREKIFARILHRSFIPINIKLRGGK